MRTDLFRCLHHAARLAVALSFAACGVASDGGETVSPDGGGAGAGGGNGATVTIYPTQLTLWDHHRARVFAKVSGASATNVAWSWDVQIPGVDFEVDEHGGHGGLVTSGTLSGRSELRAALSSSAEVADVLHIFNSGGSGCCIEVAPQDPDDVDRVHVRPGGVISIAAASAVRGTGQPRLPTLARVPLEIIDGADSANLAPDDTFTAPTTAGVVRILANRGHSGRILEIVVSADAPHTFAIVPSYAQVDNGASVSLSTTDTGGATVQWELTTLAGLFGTSPDFEAPDTGSGLVLIRAYTETTEAYGLIEHR